MTQKKVSTAINNTAAVLELDENDELVESVTTTKTLGRRKRPKESEPEAVATGLVDIEPDEDYIDAEEDDDDEDLGYSETSIAARLFGYKKDGREDYSSHRCTAIIRREPDDLRDSFLVPCSRQTYVGKIPGVAITTNEEDLAERIREMNGGGHYTVQYHYNGRIQSEAFDITIADDPTKLAAASSADVRTQPAAASLPPPVNVDPLDALLANVDKFAKLKDVFGGGDVEKVRLEMQIAELRREIEAAKNAPQERKSERLTLLETAMKEGANSGLQAKILDNLFPSEEKESRHWVAEVLDVALQNKDAILEVAGPLLMSFLGGGPRPQPMPQFAPPPPLTPEPPKVSGLFAPRVIEEPQDEPAESEPPSSEGEATEGINAFDYVFKRQTPAESEPPASAGGPTDAANEAEPEQDAAIIDADEESTDAAAAA